MSNLDEQTTALKENWTRLERLWGAATEKWNDVARLAFGKQTWSPLERQARETLMEMQSLAEVIAQARRQVK